MQIGTNCRLWRTHAGLSYEIFDLGFYFSGSIIRVRFPRVISIFSLSKFRQDIRIRHLLTVDAYSGELGLNEWEYGTYLWENMGGERGIKFRD